jgi:Pyruvate/2-oxoacid:ferredoxin oxidoreductase gamma subunit
MGKILGAAATLQGRFAAQNSIYGSAQRGISVHTEIVISNKPVKFAFVQKPDYFIILSNKQFNRFNDRLDEETVVFMNFDPAKDVILQSSRNYIPIPASEIARDMGNSVGANFVMLGKFLSNTEIMSLKLVEEAIMQNVPKQFIKQNLAALRKGFTI